MTALALPDTCVALSLSTAEFDPADAPPAEQLLTGDPAVLYHSLVTGTESAPVWLAARRTLRAFLGRVEQRADTPPTADRIAAEVAAARAEVAATLPATTDPEITQAVLRERAPLSLLGGCWLDIVSQPATQPAIVVNRLFRQQFLLRGEGNPQRGLSHLRRRALEDAGVFLPEIGSVDFLRLAGARPLTALHGACYLSLATLPASFLPELVGLHYAVLSIGMDESMLGTAPMIDAEELRATLEEYLALAGDRSGVGDRVAAGARLGALLEREHAAMLAELADWRGGLSLDARVAEIIGRHATFAGKQHRRVRVGRQLLAEALSDPDLDLAAFVTELRASPQFRPRDGSCRFLQAIKFGGPMFGVFDEREAAVFAEWADRIAAGDLPEVVLPANRVGDDAAAAWHAVLAGHRDDDVVLARAEPDDDRQFFHRLVNIEHHPNTLPLARQHAEEVLAAAEVLFDHGRDGVLTDASWLDYTPEALFARVDSIYWDKLVNPYEPLTEIPDRDEVVFGQKTFALGNMVDGAWAHRIGTTGRYSTRSQAMLYAIYADEMGRGDLRKNHLTLIYQVLASMDVHVPHIREPEFLDQDELPDDLYGVAIHPMCLALFPDSLYEEILGYTLGIEMFGLGYLRMHEMQKLRRHRFDISYEEAHLSIDNVSAGHARQAAEIIVSHLDDVARLSGPDAVERHWRRIWRGYASFAYFVEHALLGSLADKAEATGPAEPVIEDVVI